MHPLQLCKKMLSHYSYQNWWPVTEKGEFLPTYKKRGSLAERQKFEICAGAILTQNTDWKNVMKALENLNRAKMLNCEKIASAKQAGIAKLVKPSGYYNQKAKKLILFAKYVKKNYSCSVSKMFEKPLAELREELLSLHGIGPETADGIILYAAGKPSFVADAYTRRFVERFFAQTKTDYVEVKAFFESQLPADARLFNEFHALFVEHGKRSCRKKPNCAECFLKKECPFSLNANK